MRINNNIAALNAWRGLTQTDGALSKSLEKLSSGLRINRAGDDAAGLAISEKMRAQIKGLNMATKNSQDGISLIQTAEGALNETHSILQRMRELAVQAASDTNTAEDRTNLQDEVNQLLKEIDRVADTTQFNTKNLLDGSMGKGVTIAVANINTNTSLNAATVTGTVLSSLLDVNGNNLGIAVGDTIEVSYVINGTTETASLTTTDNLGATTETMAAIEALITDGTAAYAASGVTLTASATGFAGAINGLTITVKDSNGVVRSSATNALSSFSETTAAANVRTDGQATFQIGANTGQNIQLSIENMTTAALGVKDLKIGNLGQANVAIKVIDGALEKVSAQRSALGAVQNRLEHTINNLGTAAENLTAAESRIRDVDMASEMMEFTKKNILAQAGTAMLAQANQRPQSVLQLLQ